MNQNLTGIFITLIAFQSGVSNAYGQALSPDIEVSNPRVYHVKITTTFVLPKEGTKPKVLRVWHALPTARPWDGLNRTLGVSLISNEPNTGHIEHVASNETQSVFWEFSDGLSPGKSFRCLTSFRVRSADRVFNVDQCPAKWSDYPVLDVPGEVGSDLSTVVAKITKGQTPARAVLEFAKWIKEHIQYDASVPYGPDDLPAILKHEKGHCGHQMTVFEAMCARARVPARAVQGMNLQESTGNGPLSEIRADYQNCHTWAEVYLPGSGWVEIDPGAGTKAFSIPAAFVQNNADFQNYVVWIHEKGDWKQPEWDYSDGRWHSRYELQSRIVFDPGPAK